MSTIKHYASAIKAFYFDRHYKQAMQMCGSAAWGAMLKGVTFTLRLTTDKRAVLSIDELALMVSVCDQDRSLLPLKVAIIFGFFGYFRVSNLVPQTEGAFDEPWQTS